MGLSWHNAEVIPLRDDDPLEQRLRWLLGLSPEAPDPEPAVWDAGEVRFLSPKERQEEHRRWTEEDRRADIAHWGARVLQPFGSRGWARVLAGNVLSPLQNMRTRWLFARTPYLAFVSQMQEEDWVLEGDLLFEGGSLPMIFIAAEGLSDHVLSESRGQLDYLFCEENDLLFEDRWIILPGKTIDRQAVRGSLASWYKEIFKRDRRHPSQKGRLPYISVA